MSVNPDQTNLNKTTPFFVEDTFVIIPPPEDSAYSGDPFTQGETYQIFTLPVPELTRGLYQVNVDFAIYSIVVGSGTLNGAFKFTFNYNDSEVDYSNITLSPSTSNVPIVYASVKAVVPKTVLGEGVLTCVLTNNTGASITGFSWSIANVSFYPITTKFQYL